METIYDLIINENWSKAEEEARKNLKSNQNVFDLRNSIPLFLIIGAYAEAIETIEKIWALNGKDTDSDFQWASIAYIYLGRKNKAIDLLIQARKCKYTDEVGGMELEASIYALSIFYAEQEVCEEACGKILDFSKKRSAKVFFYRILGEVLFNKVNNLDNVIEEHKNKFLDTELVKLYLYQGVMAYKNDAKVDLSLYFKKCETFLPDAYFDVEFHLFKALLMFS